MSATYEDTLKSDSGLTASIVNDEWPSNPREDCDNASVLLMQGRRYSPWENGAYSKELTLEELRDAILEDDPGAYIATVHAYEHSGIAFSASRTGFSDPWDSGIAGLAYVPSKAMAEWPEGEMPENWPQSVIDDDLETYSDYCNGAVYGIIIRDPNGDELDSCYGYYGYTYAQDEAKAMLAYEDSAFRAKYLDRVIDAIGSLAANAAKFSEITS